MEQWEDDQIMSYDPNLSKYVSAPWKSLEEIEQLILNDERSSIILMKQKELLYFNRI